MTVFSTWFRRKEHVGVLGRGDRAELEDFLAMHREVSCFAMAWLQRYGIQASSGHSFFEFVGAFHNGVLTAVALLIGQNLVVLVGDGEFHMVGEHCRRRVGEVRTIVGPEHAVDEFCVGASVGSEDVELRQPQFSLSAPTRSLNLQQLAACTDDQQIDEIRELLTRLRLADRADQSPFLRATLDMFQEETALALSTREIEAFRLSVKQKIREQRAWVIFDDADRLIFKAGIGLPTPTQAHLEGVYVAPEFRGLGMGRMAMNLVCRSISSQFSLISLTVNRGNDAALALYEGMGFQPRCRYLTTYVYE